MSSEAKISSWLALDTYLREGGVVLGHAFEVFLTQGHFLLLKNHNNFYKTISCWSGFFGEIRLSLNSAKSHWKIRKLKGLFLPSKNLVVFGAEIFHIFFLKISIIFWNLQKAIISSSEMINCPAINYLIFRG